MFPFKIDRRWFWSIVSAACLTCNVWIGTQTLYLYYFWTVWSLHIIRSSKSHHLHNCNYDSKIQKMGQLSNWRLTEAAIFMTKIYLICPSFRTTDSIYRKHCDSVIQWQPTQTLSTDRPINKWCEYILMW